jgi:hypothetical protein
MVNCVEPEVTSAVSVISLPEATDPPKATMLPPEVMVRVVVVAAGAAQAWYVPAQKTVTKTAEWNNRLKIHALMDHPILALRYKRQ